MKILITGFEAFGSWQRNPSGETARHLDGFKQAASANLPSLEVTGIVLPVSFQRAASPLLSAIDELHPTVILNLGLADTAGIRVERIAVNRCTGRDNDAYEPQGKPVVAGGPETYDSLLPVNKIVTSLTAHNFTAATSDSAGTFLCNYIMYTTLHHITTHQLAIRAGFIHAAPLSSGDADSAHDKRMSLDTWINFTLQVLKVLRTPA